MAISRRRFLTGAAAAGAVLVARPSGVLAQSLGPTSAPGAARASRLFPGTWLVHADLHNHTLFSDGDGDPAAAFESMRDNGMDVAALTDHAVLGGPLGAGLTACGDQCTQVRGIDEASWAETAALADGADDPGTFCAIRGFEWSSPTLGHVNVWFGRDWVDPERTAGLAGLEGLAGYLDELPGLGPVVGEPLESLVGEAVPEGLSMGLFYDWLQAQPGSGLLGGGGDAIAGFNHPGREPGRFAMFGFDARIAERMVSLELFNRREDYLFEGVDAGRPSPLGQCLDAGWRVGILGVTDEHGTDWGAPEGKGRAGLWVRELSRAGVREALLARRFFATRERGLRLDASLGGVRMGQTVTHRSGPLRLVLDVEGGPEWAGRDLVAQVLRPGGALPAVVDEVPVRVPAPGQTPPAATVDLAADDGTWVVVRLVDPGGAPDGRASGPLAAGSAVAYTSPWWLDPAAVPAPEPSQAPGGPVPVGAAEPVPAPATLPATGALQGPRAVGAGLALGAALAAGAATRAAMASVPDGSHGHHEHDHGRSRTQGDDTGRSRMS
jgi:hypothetical protein